MVASRLKSIVFLLIFLCLPCFLYCIPEPAWQSAEPWPNFHSWSCAQLAWCKTYHWDHQFSDLCWRHRRTSRCSSPISNRSPYWRLPIDWSRHTFAMKVVYKAPNTYVSNSHFHGLRLIFGSLLSGLGRQGLLDVLELPIVLLDSVVLFGRHVVFLQWSDRLEPLWFSNEAWLVVSLCIKPCAVLLLW